MYQVGAFFASNYTTFLVQNSKLINLLYYVALSNFGGHSVFLKFLHSSPSNMRTNILMYCFCKDCARQIPQQINRISPISPLRPIGDSSQTITIQFPFSRFFVFILSWRYRMTAYCTLQNFVCNVCNKMARGCNENLVAYFASFFYIPNHHSSYILIFSYIQSLISNA